MIIGCSCHRNKLVNYLGTVDHDGDHVNESGAKKAKRFHFGADDHEYDADNNLYDDDANDDDKEDNDQLHLGAVDHECDADDADHDDKNFTWVQLTCSCQPQQPSSGRARLAFT